MWVNRTYSTSGGHTLFEDSSDYETSTTGFGLFPDDPTCNGILAGLHGDVGYSSNCYSQPSSGAWHHLAVVYDKSQPENSQVAFYVDGDLQTPTRNQAASTNTNTFGNNPIYLFSRGGMQEFTAGIMDDLQLYSRALSASEIQQIYSLGAVAMAGASVSPASLSFISQGLGITSGPQVVTLSNPGSATLSNLSIAASGDFAEKDNCGSSLAAGTSCTINVTFTPTAGGSRTATLTISDSATDSPQTVSLTGISQEPFATLTTSPSPLDFGAQPGGTTTAGQVATLSNTGAAALNIAGIAFTGANATDFAVAADTCGGTLAANAGCLIVVLFTPAAAGSRSGTLVVTDNSNNLAGSTQTAPLTGTGLHDVVLNWEPSPTAAVSGYDIFRGTISKGESTTPIATGVAAGCATLASCTYVDTAVVAGTTYYYYVTAVASNGTTQSAPSNEASANVP
jgi:hypothetical protein